MAYARQYSLSEVKFSLQFFEGNKLVTGVHAGRLTRHPHAAHPALHGGANLLEQKGRVTTPGEPRKTGTFLTKDQQAEASLLALNSGEGQTELAKIDNGTETSVFIKAPLPAGRFRMALAQDDSVGTLVRNDAARSAATTTHTRPVATECHLEAMKGPGGSLQIQTSFPVAP